MWPWWKSGEYVEDTQAGKGRFKHVPVHVMVYEINGPMFFGAADKIPPYRRGGEKRVLILRMRSVPALDITALKGASAAVGGVRPCRSAAGLFPCERAAHVGAEKNRTLPAGREGEFLSQH